MEMERPDAVLLDWDGTLVDSYAFLKAAHNHVRAALGKPVWSDGEYMEALRYSTRELYPKLYSGRADEAMKILQDYMNENHLAALTPADGAAELLEGLRTAGIPAGIISNKRHERLLAEINHLGWSGYFRVAVGAGFTERDKPAPDMMAYALGFLGLKTDPRRILYAGDMRTDLEFARNAGVGAVFLRHGMGEAGLVEEFSPLHAFADCREFGAALRGPKV